jgi:hypothetical protein
VRRLKIATSNDQAEAVHTTSGVIVAFWERAHQVYAWADLEVLREELPDAELTWIDEEVR